MTLLTKIAIAIAVLFCGGFAYSAFYDANVREWNAKYRLIGGGDHREYWRTVQALTERGARRMVEREARGKHKHTVVVVSCDMGRRLKDLEGVG